MYKDERFQLQRDLFWFSSYRFAEHGAVLDLQRTRVRGQLSHGLFDLRVLARAVRRRRARPKRYRRGRRPVRDRLFAVHQRNLLETPAVSTAGDK